MRWFALMAALGGMLIISACEAIPNQQNIEPTVTLIPTAQAAAQTTYTVERGDIEDLLEFTGRWQPRDQQGLSFERSGNVRNVAVNENDAVSEGALIADLQIDDLENTLESQQLTLENAQRNLESGGDDDTESVVEAQVNFANETLSLNSTRAGITGTGVKNARDAVDSAERSLETAERNYRDALADPSNSASAVESAYEGLIDARQSLVQAERSLLEAQAGAYSSIVGLQQAENSYILSQREYEEALQGGGNPDLIQAVQEAQLAIDQTQEEINQSTLNAPFDGVVLSIEVSPGDSVEAFNEVVTLAIPEPREIVANIAFNDVQQLEVGQVGVCQLSNDPDTAVQCIIRRLPQSSNSADQTVRVAAALDEFEPRPGAIIEVDMVLEASRDTLYLPPQAVNEFNNRTFVVLQTPDGPSVVNVEIGLRTEDRVEILSGVEEGDVIIQQ